MGTILLGTGVVVIAYAAVVLLWRDPVTDLYHRWQQQRLETALEESFQELRVALPAPAPAAPTRRSAPGSAAGNPRAVVAEVEPDALTRPALRRELAAPARIVRERLELGQPLGRIAIPRLGVDVVFVHGTRWGADLTRGPGHYERTSLPGLGKTTAIAGHRTTFGAPFRHIDDLEKGDVVELELAYGTFHYRVFSHAIVASDDWSIVRERGFDLLVLSACHPLYSAKQRWIVYARLVRVDLPGGRSLASPAL